MSDLPKLLALLQPEEAESPIAPPSLMRVMSALCEAMEAKSACLMKSEDGAVVAWLNVPEASTWDDAVLTQRHPMYERVLEAGEPMRDDEGLCLLFRLMSAPIPTLLEVRFSDALPSPDSIEWLNDFLPVMRIAVERHALAQRLQAHQGTQSLLNDLAQVATISNEAQDEESYLKQTIEIVYRATGVDHAGIVIVQTNGEKGIVRAEMPESGAVGREIDITGAEFARMRQTRESVLIHFTQESELLTPLTKRVLKDLGIVHLFIVPLFNVDGELIGTIGFDLYDEGARFTPSIQAVAETMGAQLGAGLQKLRLLGDTRRQAAQMRSVSDFGQSLQAQQKVGDILAAALDYTRKIVRFDYLAMVRLEDGDFWRMPHYADGVNQPGGRNLAPGDAEKALLREVLASGTTLVVQDYEHHSPPVTYPLLGRYRSMILLPVVAQGRDVGVVEIASREAYGYRAGDVVSLEQMANLFGNALLNARAYAESQRTAQNRALTNDVTIQLQQQADVSGMLDVTVRELGKALKARRGRIRLGVGGRDER